MGLMDKKPFIIAAIPAYNEEKTIARVVLQAQRCFSFMGSSEKRISHIFTK